MVTASVIAIPGRQENIVTAFPTAFAAIKCKAYFTRWDAAQSQQVCSLFGVAGYGKEVMPREWIYPLQPHLFEGHTFLVPKDPEHYLARLYGDWKVFPPEGKRVPERDGFLYYKG